MSYHRPHDPYAQTQSGPYSHNNGSQQPLYDAPPQQQQGGYSDNAGQYYNQQSGAAAAGYPSGHHATQSSHTFASAAGPNMPYKYEDAGQYGASDAHLPGQAGAGGARYNDYLLDGGNANNAAAAGGAGKYAYPKKKKWSKWLTIGLPLLILIIAGAVLGGIFGSRAGNDSSSSSSANDSTATSGISGETSGNKPATVENSVLSAASAAAKAGGVDDLTYQGTDLYGNPSFKAAAPNAAPSASGVNTDGFTGGLTNLRPHPRLMTTQAMWDALPGKIAKDAYLTVWNATLFANATKYFEADPQSYDIDGGFTGSGILDPAREVQLRVKTLAYAYRMTKDSKWLDRTWSELNTAMGNNQAIPWGNSQDQGSIWNAYHFLDLAELTAAFGIAYDWLYDAWTDDQRTQIREAIINNGLQYGRNAYTGNNNGADYGWWRTTGNNNGNWNCVCNSGLLLGALAIQSEDNTGIATATINDVIGNLKDGCMQGVSSDGSWSETANYWYFGTAAQARAVSALTTASGSDQGLMASNANWSKTGYFHMYISGNAGMFFYGDNGPNKYSASANGMFLWGNLANDPRFALFQRDRADAADPFSMFWYDPSTKGAFWNGLALDRFFDDKSDAWVSMRSSWTDFSGTYAAMKAGALTGHQAHGDLDVGDFVIDALGTRWAGEFGNGNYLSAGYFSNESSDSLRWQYYRKATDGQNTVVINNQNQNPDAAPTYQYGSSQTTQSGAIDFTPATTDTAYFVTDMSSAYSLPAGSISRGIRMLNGRRQVLVQDDISGNNAIDDIAWRIHTNATVKLSADRRTATLTMTTLKNPNAYGGPSPLTYSFEAKTMIVKILSPSTATFTRTIPDVRTYGTAPGGQAQGEEADQSNDGVTALSIKLKGGSAQSIQVLWQPQWAELSAADNASPASVSLADWSLTSHN